MHQNPSICQQNSHPFIRPDSVLMENLGSKVFEITGYPAFSAISFIVLWIMFAIYSDSLYHNNIKKEIAIAQLTVKDETKLLEYLRDKGGVHRWVIWLIGGLVIGAFVIGFVAAIIIPMTERP
jgi:hypothetical protein